MGVAFDASVQPSKIHHSELHADTCSGNRRSQRIAGVTARRTSEAAWSITALEKQIPLEGKHVHASPIPVPFRSNPAVEQRLQSSVLTLLLLAAVAAEAALSLALPKTQRGELNGVLLGAAAAAAAAVLLLYPAPLLRLAAPLRLAFHTPASERSFAKSFCGAHLLAYINVARGIGSRM